MPDDVIGTSVAPDLEVQAEDEVQSLMKAVAALPHGEREALLLRMHDVSYGEIARILGISMSAAKVRVHRARIKLAERQSLPGGQP